MYLDDLAIGVAGGLSEQLVWDIGTKGVKLLRYRRSCLGRCQQKLRHNRKGRMPPAILTYMGWLVKSTIS